MSTKHRALEKVDVVNSSLNPFADISQAACEAIISNANWHLFNQGGTEIDHNDIFTLGKGEFRNTTIVAQSGSGMSAFYEQIIEEASSDAEKNIGFDEL